MLVPPLHSEVVTATLDVERPARRAARSQAALQKLDAEYAPDPAGLGVTVAWGLPYFPSASRLRRGAPAVRPARRQVRAAPGRRFPSDPASTLLESNDVAVLLRSDRRDHIDVAHKALFDDLKLFTVTSIRRGFAGGGFDRQAGLPKKMAMAAGVPGADLIPDTSELFLGFTSTQKQGSARA